MNAEIKLTTRFAPREPVSFDQIIGQKRPVAAIRNWLTEQEYGSLLLYGPEGVGKKTLARLMAKAVYCKRRLPDESPCGRCATCGQFEGGGMPFGFVFFDASTSLSKDALLNFIASVKAPVLADSEFIVVYNLEKLEDKSDIFLKTVEEAREKTFVFIATDIEEVRPAILSRCRRRLELKPLLRADMSKLAEAWVNKAAQGADGSVIDLAMDYSLGLPGRLYEALTTIEREGLSTVDETAAALHLNWGDDLVEYCLAVLSGGVNSSECRGRVAGPDCDESLRRLRLFLISLYEAEALGAGALGQGDRQCRITNEGQWEELRSKIGDIAGQSDEGPQAYWRKIASQCMSPDWPDAASALDELICRIAQGA